MVSTFLPAIRQLVTRKLSAEGFSQSKIASMLGITQASVSLYLHKFEQREAYSSFAVFSISKEEADRYASLLAEDMARRPLDGVETLVTIWNGLLGRGQACGEHRRLFPSLAECDVCIKVFGSSGPKAQVAPDRVSQAVKLLESSRSFVAIMPEVSVNIAYAEGEASSPEEVVAIPGRIVRVGSFAKSLSRPEYGASSHLARLLILVKSRRTDVQAVMNLRFDARMVAVIRRLRLKILRTGGEYPKEGEDRIVEGMKVRIANAKGYDAIVDEGGFGVEPSLYLLGSDPINLARLAIKISKEYLAS